MSEAGAARRRAIALAGHLGDEQSARAGLTDDVANVRATAVGALARLRALTPADLEHAAGDPDAAVRGRVAEVAPGALDPAAAHVLLSRLLLDPDPSVVEVAAWACGEVEAVDRGVVDQLSAIARSHDDPLVREAAVAALGAIGDQTGLPAILQATTDKPAIRRRAVIALAPFDGPEVDAALERARHDRDWQVRQAAEDLLA